MKTQQKNFKHIFLKIFLIIIFWLSFTLITQAAGNTTGYAKLVSDNSQINFGCSTCNVNVTNNQITGYAWGENIGWINLGPLNLNGLINNLQGEISNYAWGENASWINFRSNSNPDLKVDINTTTGNFFGYAWSENYGWIKFDCADPNACVNTSWRPPSGSGGPPSPSCSEDIWTCSEWGECSIDGKRNRSCEITTECSNVSTPSPIIEESCTPLCTTDTWTCSEWNECSLNGEQNRTCELTNNCPNVSTPKPEEIINCTPNCTEDTWTCSEWNECSLAGEQNRTCELTNNCPNVSTPKPEEIKICESELLPPCIPGAWTCNSWNDWGACSLTDEQSRTCNSATEANNCAEVIAPVIKETKPCDELLPPCIPGAWTCNSWNDWGICSLDGKRIRSCNSASSANNCPEIYAPTIEEKENCTPTVIENIVNNIISTGSNIINIATQNVTEVFGEIAGAFTSQYENTIDAVQNILNDFPSIKKALEETSGKIISRTVTTIGLIAGAISSAAIALFLNPLSLSELFFLPFRLWSLLLSVLGLKKRARPWGTVYDSVTKQPLDPAYVILRDEKGKEVNTSITDLDGRYGFFIGPGKYSIVANKTNYLFPSKKLIGKNRDALYGDLYFGENIGINNKEEVVIKNIPLDPLKFDWNEFAKKQQKLTHFYSKRDFIIYRISNIFFYFGFFIAIISTLFVPEPYNTIIVGFYILMIILKSTGIIKAKTKGKILEKNTNRPLSFGIIRIYSAITNTEIIKKITNKYGSFYCLVPNGSYYAKIDKKIDEENYENIFTSEVFEIKKGVIDKLFEI